MKYQVSNSGKPDFEIEAVEVVEANTRNWIAKASVATILAMFLIIVIWSLAIKGPDGAKEFMPLGERILFLVLGYYFGQK